MSSVDVRAVPARDEGPEAATPPARARRRARFVLDPAALAMIYPPAVREQIERLVEMTGPPCTAADVQRDPSLLADVECLFSGWGSPVLSARLLDAAAELKVVFYGAGSVRAMMTDAAWGRGIQVTSAAAANAVPVAEFALAQVVMCLKRVWQQAFTLRQTHHWRQGPCGAGAYGSHVGVVSTGEIGRRVVARLADMDVQILAFDLHPDADLVRDCRVRYVGLAELFATCDVVTVHTPLLPQTVGMIDESLLRSMKPGASLINTARGPIVDHAALVRVLGERSDLLAVLDVTDPEPLVADHPLWNLPNVVLTPHIAGSRGDECARMGQWMVEDLRRYLAELPMRGRVCPDRASRRA